MAASSSWGAFHFEPDGKSILVRSLSKRPPLVFVGHYTLSGRESHPRSILWGISFWANGRAIRVQSHSIWRVLSSSCGGVSFWADGKRRQQHGVCCSEPLFSQERCHVYRPGRSRGHTLYHNEEAASTQSNKLYSLRIRKLLKPQEKTEVTSIRIG